MGSGMCIVLEFVPFCVYRGQVHQIILLGLHLHYVWPRGKLAGPARASRSIELVRARWPGPSPEPANEDY
jgi:hypothetical protein